MLKKLFISIAILMFSATAYAEPKLATTTIDDFYKRYIGYDQTKTPTTARPVIAMSASFSNAIKQNAAICKKYASGPCGWGADGDEYLDAQEMDPKLTYENSRISIKEIQPNMVQVKLNVYPSIKNAGDYYDRTITYKMIKENGSWVVDDVMYADDVSTVRTLVDESADAMAHPDPDVNQPQKDNH